MTSEHNEYLAGFGSAAFHATILWCPPSECLESARDYSHTQPLDEWVRGYVDGMLSGFGF